VTFIIFCMGRLTYMSFMSKVVILCWLLIWMLFGSCAATFEILVAYLYGNFIKSLIQIFGKFIRWRLYIIYFWPDGFFLLYVFWSRRWVWVPYVLSVPDICVGFCLFCYICVWFVECVFEIFIPGFYSIFLYEGINLLFQFMYFDHGSTYIHFCCH
jgi:hypothetical protein